MKSEIENQIPPIKIIVDPAQINNSDNNQNKFLKTVIYLLSSILLIIIGVITYYFINYQNFSLQTEKSENTEKIGDKIDKSDEAIDLFKNDEKKAENDIKGSQEVEIVAVDNVWNQYNDLNLGVSFRFPKKFMHGNGACPYVESNGDHSYRPKLADVNTKIFVDSQTIYLAGESFYKLGGETSENSRSYFANCDLINNNLNLIQQDRPRQPYSLALQTAEVANDQQLTSFIQENYGQGCRLGQKQATVQADIFNVKIDTGQFNSLEEAEANGCLINYAYTIIYDQGKNKVLSVSLGQACNLYKNMGGGNNCYDQEIVDSFKFK